MSLPVSAFGLWRSVVAVAVAVAVTLCLATGARADGMMRSKVVASFIQFDPDYLRLRQVYGDRIEAAAASIAEAERAGKQLHCSQQMLLEAKWLHRYRAQWSVLDDKLRRIDKSLADTDQGFALKQNPASGFWGACYDNEVLRIGSTIVEVERLASLGETPVYPLRMTESTGSRLLQRLQTLLISDIRNTGIDNRGELSNLMTTMAQATFKKHLREMLPAIVELGPNTKPRAMEEVFRFFLAGAQDPATGYWGAWYLIDDQIVKTADLSMTFHVIKYSKGNVQYWPQIIDTTIASKHAPYPYGWRSISGWNNHNLYDVAVIFRYGWPHMDEMQRARVAVTIEEMIEWSLSNTVLGDEGVTHDPLQSDSLADAYYFWISFLDAVGYWNPERRFWSDTLSADLAGRADCEAIHRAILDLDPEGWAGDGARAKMAQNCPIE